MIKTLAQFKTRVISGGDPYEMFEDECSEPVRAEIYQLAFDQTEPFRSAMRRMGFWWY